MAARAGWLGVGAMVLLAMSPADARAFNPTPYLGAEVGLAWQDGLKLTAGLSLRTANLFGPLVRIEALGLTAGRLTVGAQFSGMRNDFSAVLVLVGAEAGLGAVVPWRAPRDYVLGLHGAAGLDLGEGGAWLRVWGPIEETTLGWIPSVAVDLTPSRHLWRWE